MTDLRAWFQSNLPPPVSDLMQTVEDYADTKISIKLIDGRHSYGSLTTNEMAEIAVNQIRRLNAHSACHELIHIKRYWMDRSPVLRAAAPAASAFAGLINNKIEHILMADEERSYGYDPIAFWSQNVGSGLQRNLDQVSTHFGRSRVFLNALINRPIISADLYERIAEQAAAMGAAAARSAAEDVLAHLDRGKIHAVRSAAHHWQIDLRDLYMVEIDIKSRVERVVPVLD